MANTSYIEYRYMRVRVRQDFQQGACQCFIIDMTIHINKRIYVAEKYVKPERRDLFEENTYFRKLL